MCSVNISKAIRMNEKINERKDILVVLVGELASCD